MLVRSNLCADVSTTMILTPGPVIDFLIANQNVQEPRQIDWMKVGNKYIAFCGTNAGLNKFQFWKSAGEKNVEEYED